ncbi:antitoxin [Mycobacterium sp. SMC-18]|uniref:antitoxin n=1 Tax=Mycobacteriaceae TaxID=1762 RepID=UPI001BB3B848|nr:MULTISPECIES: antitoxin [unclassified Mycolicibacterium]MDX1880729.1 antitoxin [Mycolicibacterium sp. 141076]BCI84027.1 kanamycin biosynthetic protein [Mycolicibacterium sp. TY66]BCJ84354.1 kanamycin biosynthetic protein [Mycolicibacterium sp. TY81]
MGFLDKVKDLAAQNADKVEAAIEKVGDIVDEKTEGKFKGAVDSAQEAAKKAVAGDQPAAEAPAEGTQEQQ